MNSRDCLWTLVGLVIGAGLSFGVGSLFHARSGSSSQKATLSVNQTALSRGGHVYLSGQVHKEGAIQLSPGETLTVSQAIITDGGLTDFADKRNVKLVRAGSSGGSTQENVDLVDILDQGHLEKDPAVAPGDMIIVPERVVNF